MTANSIENLLKAFPEELNLVLGDKNLVFTAPASQDEPQKSSIVFVNKLEAAKNALLAGATCLVIPEAAAPLVHELKVENCAIITAKDTKLMMAKVNQHFFPIKDKMQRFGDIEIHPSAVIHPSAEIGKNVIIGPCTVICAAVKIGAGTYIGPNCTIETKAQIGQDCFIHSNVVIAHGCTLYNRIEIKSCCTIGGEGFGYAQDENRHSYRIPHYGGLIIEDDVHIGANVSIDRGTFGDSRIGANTKIDNHGHFAHNTEIGKNGLVTAGFISAGSAKIGDNCTFAGRASVNGHISICDNVTVGPLSAVTNSLTKPGMYAGFPVIDFKKFRRVQASLASLPRIRKDVASLLKKVGLSSAKD